MRFAGRITDWNDTKGFGFVVPNGAIKQPFQVVFWGTVVLNLVLVAWLVLSGTAAGVARSLGF